MKGDERRVVIACARDRPSSARDQIFSKSNFNKQKENLSSLSFVANSRRDYAINSLAMLAA